MTRELKEDTTKKEMCVHMSKSNMQVKASGEGEVYAEQEAKPKAKATG